MSNHDDAGLIARRPRPAVRTDPVTAATKPEAEARLLDLVKSSRTDLVVLARYMQILSGTACARLVGSAINIHHSFPAGFAGARPYQRRTLAGSS